MPKTTLPGGLKLDRKQLIVGGVALAIVVFLWVRSRNANAASTGTGTGSSATGDPFAGSGGDGATTSSGDPLPNPPPGAAIPDPGAPGGVSNPPPPELFFPAPQPSVPNATTPAVILASRPASVTHEQTAVAEASSPVTTPHGVSMLASTTVYPAPVTATQAAEVRAHTAAVQAQGFHTAGF